MADDTQQTASDTIATDHVTTLNGATVTQTSTSPKVQRVKVGYGDDGTFRDASALFPLPVNLATSQGNVPAVSQVLSAAGANTPGTLSIASGTGQAVAAVVSAGNVTFHIVTSAFVGTLAFEASVDGGLNYAPVMAVREDGSAAETSTAISTAAAFIRTYTAGIPGFTHFRVRVSAFTSGTAAIYMTQGPFLIETNPSIAGGQVGAQLWNPSTSAWESYRNNADTATVSASSAKTSTASSATMTNINARSAVIGINVSAVSGTSPTCAFRIDFLDPVSGNWMILSLTGANVTAVSTPIIAIGPGVTTAPPATGSLAVGLPLPRSWRLSWVIAGVNPSFTFSAGVTYNL